MSWLPHNIRLNSVAVNWLPGSLPARDSVSLSPLSTASYLRKAWSNSPEMQMEADKS